MQLADRVNRISISPTAAVLAAAERYRAQGADLADFGPGEPDFPTPEHIVNAAIRALHEGRTKYSPTAGIGPLREAICKWHAAQFGSSYTVPECVVTVGGKHAIFNAFCSLLGAGDEVLIPAPYWVSYPDMVMYTGATPVPVMTDPSDGFRLRAEAVARAITPRTKLLIVNSPSNPSGAVVPADEFARIYEVCRAKHIWLLTDECYSHFVYGNAKPFSLASLPGTKPNIIVAGSLSKTFAMTGWRIGYALAPDRADLRDDQAAEPVHVESNLDRPIRGARSADRPDGHGRGHARGVLAAPRSHRRRTSRDSRSHLRRAGRRVLCVPERCRALAQWHCRFDRAGETASRAPAPGRRARRRLRYARLSPNFLCHFDRPDRGRACGAWRNSSRWRHRPRESRFKPIRASACEARPYIQAPHLGCAGSLSIISRTIRRNPSRWARRGSRAMNAALLPANSQGARLGEVWPELRRGVDGHTPARACTASRCS